MDINYELYKVFYYVASSLSFSDASKKLFISQSAVSQSIKTLERKLGQPLFIRSTKKVQLTPAGALLLKHVEPAMNLISRGESQLLESGSLGLGQLHIGASDTICRYFLLPYLQKFHRKFPDVPIKITNASSMGCVDLLEQRRVDLIITNFPNPHLNPSYIQKTVGSFSDNIKQISFSIRILNPVVSSQTVWHILIVSGHQEIVNGRSYGICHLRFFLCNILFKRNHDPTKLFVHSSTQCFRQIIYTVHGFLILVCHIVL